MSTHAAPLRGVNLSGAEWGESSLPGVAGRDYTGHSERSYAYWASKDLRLIRIPFLWERLQPTLGAPLDAAYLAILHDNAGWAATHGIKLYIEPQNFGRFRGSPIDDHGWLAEPSVTRHHFADLWQRLSAEFRHHPGVAGYDLMNEPHHLGRGDWRTISLCAVEAIRATGDSKLILVPGADWSSAERWEAANGASAWIPAGLGPVEYEAHCYFDSDGSGRYRLTYDEETAQQGDLVQLARRRLAPFTGWCQRNGVRGYLGEVGVPNDDPRWLAVLQAALDAADSAGMDVTYWAAGEWWESYHIGIQPLDGFSVDRPQLALLQRRPVSG